MRFERLKELARRHQELGAQQSNQQRGLNKDGSRSSCGAEAGGDAGGKWTATARNSHQQPTKPRSQPVQQNSRDSRGQQGQQGQQEQFSGSAGQSQSGRAGAAAPARVGSRAVRMKQALDRSMRPAAAGR